MQRFEYMSLPLPHDNDDLNRFGNEGWELIQFHPYTKAAVFKRPIELNIGDLLSQAEESDPQDRYESLASCIPEHLIQRAREARTKLNYKRNHDVTSS